MNKAELEKLLRYIPADADEIIIGGAGHRMSFSSARITEVSSLFTLVNEGPVYKTRPERFGKYRFVEQRKPPVLASKDQNGPREES